MKPLPLSILAVFVLVLGTQSAELPKEPVRIQPARWRAVRQVMQLGAEQVGYRWAMPATISRRALVGNADGKALPAVELLQDVAKQTGLTVESSNGILLVHVARQQEMKEIIEQLKATERGKRLTAISRLGWLTDARAFPELARLVVGEDIEMALAAAQALRRLDGEKDLDWRMHGVSAEDPEYVNAAGVVAPWQAPLGMAFPRCVDRAGVERLASSTYLPLREAAARLTASLGKDGNSLCEKLAADLCPLVKAAATRTLTAWAEPVREAKKPQKKPDGSTPWWEKPMPDLKQAAKQLDEAKDHDTVWRLLGRRVAYESAPEAIKVMLDFGGSGKRWSSMVTRPLAEFNGGPDVLNWLKRTADGMPEPNHQQGWALWGLSAMQDGEELTKSLRPALESRAFWAAPPEYTVALAGRPALLLLLARMEKRGHWVCLALGHIGGPEATEALIAQLDSADPGVAVAAAKGLGDTAAFAGVKPLIAQLSHKDRLRRHWAVLGLGRIGGPDAARALTDYLAKEEQRKDRLIARAAATFLNEIGSLSPEAKRLVARFEEEDRQLVPVYQPRNPRFDDRFPVNTEVLIKEHRPFTYSSIGETRAALDWANRLLFRYGGCTGCYSNEFFAFDVGTGTWFPIRASDHYCHLFNEVRPNAGCSRGMTFDGINRLVWIGQGIGSSTGPTSVTHNRSNGLAAYDAALDRFYPCANANTMAKAYSGEPAKAFAFDHDANILYGSQSGGKGISILDASTRKTSILEAPSKMPSWDQYRPPAFAIDPVSQNLLCTHPDIGWKLLTYDRKANSFELSETPYPDTADKQIMGGLVYDSLNREMILIGGSRGGKSMPTCRYDRKTGKWIDLQVKELGHMGLGQDTCVFDPEHNVILEPIRGGAYRYKAVPTGTATFYGGGIGKRE